MKQSDMLWIAAAVAALSYYAVLLTGNASLIPLPFWLILIAIVIAGFIRMVMLDNGDGISSMESSDGCLGDILGIVIYSLFWPPVEVIRAAWKTARGTWTDTRE